MDKPTKKIRILHIIGSMRLGGAQVCVKNIIEGNTDPNIEHFLYPLRPKNPVFEVDCKKFIYDYPNYDPRKFLAILQICRENRIDIIHTHLSKPSIMAMVLKSFLKCKIIVHDHGTITYKTFEGAFYRTAIKLLKRNIDKIIAVSESVKKGFIKTIGSSNKIELVYNAINEVEFQPEQYSKDVIKAELDIAPDTKILGFVGRLNKIKGVEIAIRTLSNLRKSEDATLVIVGDGPEKNNLITLAKRLGLSEKDILFLGFKQDVAKYISIFDYAIIPSLKESFGIVALEFMRMKTPILCSGIDGLSEIINHKETGIIIKDNLPEKYANAIMKLENDSELKDKLINNALEFSDNFTRDKYIKKINNIYYDIIS